ncbi:hypothetical protein BDN70DRAFT_878355 [Pholiota conissans]|uniref:Uncharacterized protein n=1 Tax=Pholiota conissans TaxID=109636 RepID=A0A9P6D1M4_9AGAR|nr:hypothetical protein BDN70DRAFT_878355 [Pholiota conissans]
MQQTYSFDGHNNDNAVKRTDMRVLFHAIRKGALLKAPVKTPTTDLLQTIPACSGSLESDVGLEDSTLGRRP